MQIIQQLQKVLPNTPVLPVFGFYQAMMFTQWAPACGDVSEWVHGHGWVVKCTRGVFPQITIVKKSDIIVY